MYRGRVASSDPAYRLPDWRPGRLTGLWRAQFDNQPEVGARALEHLEETAPSLNRKIEDWLEQGRVERSEMQGLLQEIEDVKQLGQMLSCRSDASRNQSGAPGTTSAGPPPSALATGRR